MPLDPNRFTRKTAEALGAAQAAAASANHSQVSSEHLLAALVTQPETVVLPVLARLGVSAKTAQQRLEEHLASLPKVYGQTTQQAQLAPDAYRLLESADRQREALGDDYLSTEHVVLAGIDAPGRGGEI